MAVGIFSVRCSGMQLNFVVTPVIFWKSSCGSVVATGAAGAILTHQKNVKNF